MENQQREIVMVAIRLTVLAFVPIIMAAYSSYDMGGWPISTFPATFPVMSGLLLLSVFEGK